MVGEAGSGRHLYAIGQNSLPASRLSQSSRCGHSAQSQALPRGSSKKPSQTQTVHSILSLSTQHPLASTLLLPPLLKLLSHALSLS